MFPIKNQPFGSNNEVADLSFRKQAASHKGLVISYRCFLESARGFEPPHYGFADRAINRSGTPTYNFVEVTGFEPIHRNGYRLLVVFKTTALRN